MRGKFITFEGIDGAGKSSHIKAAADLLASKGIEVITTREPGGTPLGEKLRAILLAEKMDLQTEALLMFASRQEHLAQVIEPALARGAWVISDRFSDSTFAYQCGGKGYPEAKFLTLESLVHSHLKPDATFLFDVPSDVAHDRIKDNRTLDKFEQEQPEFHERVRFAYLRRATTTESYRFHMLDATRPVGHVWSQVQKVIESMVEPGGA